MHLKRRLYSNHNQAFWPSSLFIGETAGLRSPRVHIDLRLAFESASLKLLLYKEEHPQNQTKHSWISSALVSKIENHCNHEIVPGPCCAGAGFCSLHRGTR
ncbi:hypothetical protein NL108_000086 [Boleophthalmus pectinirostris]|nr:hypothetical protein NL108_000086 [Boleophthalmus pectinirostris]